MIIAKILIMTMLSLPSKASDSDEDIILNLDFFQSLEMIKEEYPMIYIEEDLDIKKGLKVEKKQ